MDSTRQSPKLVRHSKPTSVWVGNAKSDAFWASFTAFSWATVWLASGLDGVFTGLFEWIRLAGTVHENDANDILRTRAPSWAVSLYFVTGFNCGKENTLNCSSEAMRTRCGNVPGPDNSSGTPALSNMAMPTTGARCFNWIDLASTAVIIFLCSGGVSLAAFDGMFNTYTDTQLELVADQSVGIVVWTRREIAQWINILFKHSEIATLTVCDECLREC